MANMRVKATLRHIQNHIQSLLVVGQTPVICGSPIRFCIQTLVRNLGEVIPALRR